MRTSSPLTDLGPYQPLRGQEHLYQAYKAPIENDPAAAAKKLRQLHRDTPLGTENEEFYAWTDRIGCVLSRSEFLERRLWRKFINADIANICLDIIMRDDFWQSPWVSFEQSAWTFYA